MVVSNDDSEDGEEAALELDGVEWADVVEELDCIASHYVRSDRRIVADVWHGPLLMDEDGETADDRTAEGLGIGELTIEDVDDEY